MNVGERPKVLVIAEAANPEWVSVPLVGWSLASALRRVADVHLVTHVRNEEAIVRSGWVAGRDFTSLDNEAVAGPMWKLVDRLRGSSGVGWTLVTAMAVPSYYWFEHLVWRRFADDLRAGKWDIVHRVTPLSPTTPSLIATRLRKLGIPFVVGPLNGGVPWPREFRQARRQEKEWLSYVRDAYRLLPGYRGMRQAAAAIIVGSRATREQQGGRWMAKTVYIPENAVSLANAEDSEARPPAPPLRIIFVGRLVPYKGADMLIDAAAELVRAGKARVEIVGDGPQRPALEKQVGSLGVGGGISFTGWLDHAGVARRLREAHVLGFPSIREFGGGAVIEAMAAKVVPVVVDYAGPSELVTAETGCLVPLAPRQAIVAGVRAQLERLVANEDERKAMARAGRERISRWFTWERKAEQVSAVYAWVLGRASKPDFGMPFP